MATLTSVKSGYWSDPTTWDLGVVPANGDTVTIASGHTVTFDVDQTSFTNGLAGLTINGTLKFPSQSEDPNMPQFVHLKVNANIAGTGSLLVGSSTYPITYPQQVKISVNGTITTATVQMYGEQRRPCFDYLAQNAAAGATTIVLTNGMPLRAGDVIAIGRSDTNVYWTTGENFTHTVTAYDAATKTVTISPSLQKARNGIFPYNCMVILLSRVVNVEKYGANSGALISGSRRTLMGVMFTRGAGATLSYFCNLTSFSISDCAFYLPQNSGYHFYNSSNGVVDNSVFYGQAAISLLEQSSGITVNNSAVMNLERCIAFDGAGYNNIKFDNVHVANNYIAFFRINTQTGATAGHSLINCTVKYSREFNNLISADIGVTFDNILLVEARNLWSRSPRGFHLMGRMSNLSVYNSMSDMVFDWGHNCGDYFILENITVNLQNRNFTNRGIPVTGIHLRSITIRGQGTCYLHLGANLVENLTIEATPSNPLGTAYSRCRIRNLSTPQYNRFAVANSYGGITFSDYFLQTTFVEVMGLTVAGTSYPKAYERIFNYGYIKNRWDASPSDYTTFDFYLTNTSLAKPLYLDYKVRGDNPIVVTGNITQLAAGDSVKVQIFSADKEPLLGDTADFEQTFTTTGAININWTPPDAREWVVRVSAIMAQTTTPTTIQNLEVGAGAGGGAAPSGEPAFVWFGM